MARRYDSQKEKFLLHNTLALAAYTMIGKCTSIDLRNETTVSGMIEHVDGFMNVYLSDVYLRDHRDKELTFESLFIQSRNVMFIHIPKGFNVMEHMEQVLEPKRMTRNGKTLKQKRCQAMNEEILTKFSEIKRQRQLQEQQNIDKPGTSKM